MSQVLYTALIGCVALERLFELRLSRRNLASVLGRGGLLVPEGIYPWIAGMHGLFLLSCVGEVWILDRAFPGAMGWVALGAVIGAQGLRYWAVRSLGDRWNVRIVIVPGEAPSQAGPYRWLRHPNYLAVVIEIVALPLVHGAVLTAPLFAVANALLLRRRIAVEEEALGLGPGPAPS